MNDSRIPTSRRLPLRLKPIIPVDVERLSDDLRENTANYDEQIQCWTCSNILPLQELNYDWPVGKFSFLFPWIPAYRCEPCHRTYFPEQVRLAMAACVESELQNLTIEPPKLNPATKRFATRFKAAGYKR